MIAKLLPLLLPVWLVLAAPPVRSQGEQSTEQKLDAVKEFARFFKKYKQVAQKVEAVLSLEAADCAEAVDALAPLLAHKTTEIRNAAKRVLSGFREPRSFDAVMARLVEMTDRDMRAELIDVVSRAGQKKLRQTLLEIWNAEKSRLNVPEKFHIARALGRLGAKGYEEVLAELVQDRAYEVRVAACDAIAANRLKELGPRVVPLLGDAVWQVQAAAMKCLGTLRTREAVEPMIEFLRKPGRLKQDAADALFLITAYDFGTSYDIWKKQWKMLTGLPNFRLPTDAELAKAAEARKKANKLYKPGPGKKTFAGIPTHSTRVIFVIDVSASMEDLVTDRQKFKDGGYPSYRKIDIVKTELLRTINSLDKNTYFNILAFAKTVKDWKKWLTRATINYKASAISFVKRLQPLGVAKSGSFGGGAADDSGKTNTYAALMRAFDLDPAKGVVLTGKGDKKPPQLDTIYFLTDGRPTIGKFVDTEDILKEVRKINELRGIVIHTISIGEFEASFLRRLADQNGGVFVNLGG